jgi:hypothetical protein
MPAIDLIDEERAALMAAIRRIMSGIGSRNLRARFSSGYSARGSEGKARDRAGRREAVCSSCCIALVHVGM